MILNSLEINHFICNDLILHTFMLVCSHLMTRWRLHIQRYELCDWPVFFIKTSLQRKKLEIIYLFIQNSSYYINNTFNNLLNMANGNRITLARNTLSSSNFIKNNTSSNERTNETMIFRSPTRASIARKITISFVS